MNKIKMYSTEFEMSKRDEMDLRVKYAMDNITNSLIESGLPVCEQIIMLLFHIKYNAYNDERLEKCEHFKAIIQKIDEFIDIYSGKRRQK